MADINKLPKWAQQEIKDLRRVSEERAATIKELTGGTDPESAHVEVDISDGATMRHPRHTPVRFVLEAKGEKHRAMSVEALVMTDKDGTRFLRLIGDTGVSILPFATNGLNIKFAK